MNRGSPLDTRGCSNLGYTFNEAPIHESGKSSDAEGKMKTRFPSMRPRFMNRGSLPGRFHRRRTLPPFNEAPIHESGKSFSPARTTHHD